MKLNCKIKKAAASRFADRVAVFFIFVLPSRAAAFCVSKGNDSVLRKDRKKVFTLYAAKKRGKNRKREGHFRLCPSLLTLSPQLPKTKSLESSL